MIRQHRELFPRPCSLLCPPSAFCPSTQSLPPGASSAISLRHGTRLFTAAGEKKKTPVEGRGSPLGRYFIYCLSGAACKRSALNQNNQLVLPGFANGSWDLSSSGAAWVGHGGAGRGLALTGKNIAGQPSSCASAAPEPRGEQKRAAPEQDGSSSGDGRCCGRTDELRRQTGGRKLPFCRVKLRAEG